MVRRIAAAVFAAAALIAVPVTVNMHYHTGPIAMHYHAPPTSGPDMHYHT